MANQKQGPIGATGKTGAIGPTGPAGAIDTATSARIAHLETEFAAFKKLSAEHHVEYEQLISKIKAHVASDNPDVKSLRSGLAALEKVVADRRSFWQEKSEREEASDRAQETR